jgi:hypothetical protein
VFITAAGRSFRQAAIDSLMPDMQAIAKAYPVEAVADLLPTLAALRQTMDRMRDEA